MFADSDHFSMGLKMSWVYCSGFSRMTTVKSKQKNAYKYTKMK